MMLRNGEILKESLEARSTSNVNFGTLLIHGAKVNISIELGDEVNIWCRSPQLGAEVTAVRKLLVPNIDCPVHKVQFKTNKYDSINFA